MPDLVSDSTDEDRIVFAHADPTNLMLPTRQQLGRTCEIDTSTQLAEHATRS